ncbi:hypothetical protein LXL04_009632 [Taraxacum kok-saghyz]
MGGVRSTIFLFIFLKLSITIASNDSFWLLKIQSEFVDSTGVFKNSSPGSNICTWNGVQCSEDDQTRVVGINLSNSGLSGTISPDFSKLVSLQKLDLSVNSLTGEIPKKLGELQELQELYLFSNYLTGSMPVEFRLLKKLRVLRIGDNLLTGEIIESIGELSELRYSFKNWEIEVVEVTSVTDDLGVENEINLGGCCELDFKQDPETVAIEDAVKVLLEGLGEDINREGMQIHMLCMRSTCD